jgi:thymidylate synthase
MSKNNKQIYFTKKINCSNFIELTLSEEEVNQNLIEFVWFFNGTNNIKFLLENNHYGFIDILYKKYNNEIDNLIKYYDLSNIIEESDFCHGWFSNWRQLQKFSQSEFVAKIKTDLEFSSIWADFGISDSLEFRNWGIEISFDSEDRGSISKKGNDQFRQLINSLAMDPENGSHIISLYNVSNIEERLVKNNLILIKFFCEKLNYDQRVEWFFQNHYETGMELDILKDNFKKENLDSIKWYDSLVSIPKYRLNIASDYNIIENNLELDKIILFNSLFLKFVSKLFNMLPNNVMVNSIYKINDSNKKRTKIKYNISVVDKKFDSLNLEIKDFNIKIK